jgi:hypothetical protein
MLSSRKSSTRRRWNVAPALGVVGEHVFEQRRRAGERFALVGKNAGRNTGMAG